MKDQNRTVDKGLWHYAATPEAKAMNDLELEIAKGLRRIVIIMQLIALLLSLALNAAVMFSIPVLDWRTYALAACGGLSLFAAVAPYLFPPIFRRMFRQIYRKYFQE